MNSVFSWLIDCFVEMQNNLNDKDDIKNIGKYYRIFYIY